MKFRITQKVNKMSEEKKVDDLAHEAAILSLIPNEVVPCKENDTACTKRWIESLSDCA